jgi:integrase
MSPRSRHHGVRKVCACGWRQWPKCSHAWYFSYKPRGALRQRFSLDAELGRHLESLTEARDAATTIRAAILAGTFRRATTGVPVPIMLGPVLDQVAELYLAAIAAAGKRSVPSDASRLARLRAYPTADGRRLGAWRMTDITEEVLEGFHASLQTSRQAASTRNHFATLLKALFRWAVRKGAISRSPISHESTLRRAKVAQRRRRVSATEETALLAAAGALTRGAGLRLQWLIIAAVETGARIGELLAIRWTDVTLDKRRLLIRAVEEGAKKTGRARELPVSSRLAGVLEMARLDPAGRPYPPPAYVFGALGNRLKSVKKAWTTAVLRAHDHEPVWVVGKLALVSRERLQNIDLHFHDLRHEAGCRWLEAGWPIHHVQEMLGHTNLSQTSTYLHAAEMGLQESMRRFDAARGKPVANLPSKEPSSIGHEQVEQPPKDLLH